MHNDGVSKEALALAAAMLGRRGGLVGGPARARKLTPEQRSEIARMGAVATNLKRWGTKAGGESEKPLDSPSE